MYQKIVMEGNAFYEIDEECLQKKQQQDKKEESPGKKKKKEK